MIKAFEKSENKIFKHMGAQGGQTQVMVGADSSRNFTSKVSAMQGDDVPDLSLPSKRQNIHYINSSFDRGASGNG